MRHPARSREGKRQGTLYLMRSSKGIFREGTMIVQVRTEGRRDWRQERKIRVRPSKIPTTGVLCVFHHGAILWMSVCHTCVHTCRGQKRASEPLELELQVAVSYLTQVL